MIPPANTRIVTAKGHEIVVIDSPRPVVTDVQSALDLIASANYEHDYRRIAVNKGAVAEEFFRLSTGLAGDIVQKFVTYRCALAIIGDFSGYTSEPLRDYIRESNKGRHLFFVKDEAEAIERLSM